MLDGKTVLLNDVGLPMGCPGFNVFAVSVDTGEKADALAKDFAELIKKHNLPGSVQVITMNMETKDY